MLKIKKKYYKDNFKPILLIFNQKIKKCSKIYKIYMKRN